MLAVQKRYNISPLGHSADVSLRLHVAGQTISLRQTSTTAIKLGQDVVIAPGPARVEIITDGVSHFSDVTIIGRQPNSLWLDIKDVR